MPQLLRVGTLMGPSIVTDSYAVAGFSPELVVDAAGVLNSGTEFFRSGGSTTTYTSLFGTAFDRSGVATMVDSSGNLKWSAHNLSPNSEDFLTGWAGGNWSVSTNVAADPAGGTTADKLIPDTGTSTQSLGQNVTYVVGAQYTVKCWASADEMTEFYIRPALSNSFRCLFDMDAETVTPSGGTGSITAVGVGGLYLCEYTWTETTGGSRNCGFQTSQTANSSDGFNVWGFHVYRSDLGGMVDIPLDERGLSTDTTYLPTTTAARYLLRRQAYAPINGTWTLKGFQLEEARTNDFTESQDLSDAAWSQTGVGSITQDATGPDGETSAYTLTSSSTACRIQEDVTVSTSTAYTVSVYAKAGNQDFLNITLVSFTTPANSDNFFNLATGSLGAQTGGSVDDRQIEDVGGGWYRCSVTFTTDATDTAGTIRLNLVKGDGQTTCNVSDTIILFGAQFEAGAFPSSLIPTTGATATRAADVTTDQIVAAKLPYSATAMSVAYEALMSYADGATAYQIRPVEWRLDGNNLIQFYIDTNSTRTGQVRGLTESGGVLDLVTASPDYTPGVNVAMKAAMRVAAESSGGAGDGEVQVAKDGSSGTANTTVGTLPDLSATNLDFFDTGGNGFVSLFRMWGSDIGDTGIESAST